MFLTAALQCSVISATDAAAALRWGDFSERAALFSRSSSARAFALVSLPPKELQVRVAR